MRDSWSIVEPSLPALSYTYSFGPGLANALALVAPGGLIVVSAPYQPKASAFTELEKYGPVRAIVAPNAYHHMGVGSWKERYPDAGIYAPAQSIKRVEKQTKLSGIRPLADMDAKLLGDKLEMVDMPHYKSGEVLVRWRVPNDGGSPQTPGGWAWYVTDVMFNMPELPPNFFGKIMKWTKSGPGLRRNALATTFMVKDKRSLFAWMVEQAEKTPPAVVVACHGAVAKLSDPAGEIRSAVS